jgi:CRISPR-associated protein Csm2
MTYDRKKQYNHQIPQEDLKKIIIGDDAVESARFTDKWGQELGYAFKNAGLTTSQIRNVFGQVRRIEMQWDIDKEPIVAHRNLLLIRQKMNYQAARHSSSNPNKKGVEHLAKVINDAISLVDSSNEEQNTIRERFQRFVDFFEAILAYHKAAGGQ